MWKNDSSRCATVCDQSSQLSGRQSKCSAFISNVELLTPGLAQLDVGTCKFKNNLKGFGEANRFCGDIIKVAVAEHSEHKQLFSSHAQRLPCLFWCQLIMFFAHYPPAVHPCQSTNGRFQTLMITDLIRTSRRVNANTPTNLFSAQKRKLVLVVAYIYFTLFLSITPGNGCRGSRQHAKPNFWVCILKKHIVSFRSIATCVDMMCIVVIFFKYNYNSIFWLN